MKYPRLTVREYKKLWLLMTPDEIKEEFGLHSHSPRQIRRYYTEYGVNRIQQSKKELEEKVQLKQPYDVDGKALLVECMKELREEVVEEIWTHIQEENIELGFS